MTPHSMNKHTGEVRLGSHGWFPFPARAVPPMQRPLPGIQNRDLLFWLTDARGNRHDTIYQNRDFLFWLTDARGSRRDTIYKIGTSYFA